MSKGWLGKCRSGLSSCCPLSFVTGKTDMTTLVKNHHSLLQRIGGGNDHTRHANVRHQGKHLVFYVGYRGDEDDDEGKWLTCYRQLSPARPPKGGRGTPTTYDHDHRQICLTSTTQSKTRTPKRGRTGKKASSSYHHLSLPVGLFTSLALGLPFEVV